MKAAIYCRVSTENQEREGTSLESQREACLNKAKELGYEVGPARILKEVYSGLEIERPLLTELREWVRNKEIDAVVVYSTDRLSRDPLHLLLLADECDKAGVYLCFVTEPMDNSMEGQLLGFVRGWANKLEAIRIKERSIRGKKQRALQGKLPSGRKLYGFDYIKGKGVGEGIRYINENETKWVREIYRWLVGEGLTLNAITYRLRALGVPTPAGSKFWLRQTVYRILSNPAYIGKTYSFTRTSVEPKTRRKPNSKCKKTGVAWKPKSEWITIEGATPAIISEDLFNEAQKILKRNKELSSRNAKRQYLLSGYIFCRCSRRYIGYVRKWKGKGKRYEQRYYRCGASQSIVSPERCDNRQLHAPTIEDAVWGEIELLLSKPEMVLSELQSRQKEASKVSHLERNLEAIRARLQHKEKEKDRIHRVFYLMGDEQRFRADIATLTEENKTLQEEEVNLISGIEASQKFAPDVEGIKQACELVRSNLGSLGFGDKRLALEALQIKVKVDGKDINIEGVIPIQPRSFESSASRAGLHNISQAYPFSTPVIVGER